MKIMPYKMQYQSPECILMQVRFLPALSAIVQRGLMPAVGTYDRIVNMRHTVK